MNPAAVEHLLRSATLTKKELCEASGVTPGHLSDMLNRRKGASATVIRKMAETLGCDPAVIAPEVTGIFRAVRPGDPVEGDE